MSRYRPDLQSISRTAAIHGLDGDSSSQQRLYNFANGISAPNTMSAYKPKAAEASSRVRSPALGTESCGSATIYLLRLSYLVICETLRSARRGQSRKVPFTMEVVDL